MDVGSSFDCCIIGQGRLTLECGERLLEAGAQIKGIVSDNFDVQTWAQSKGIAYANSQTDLLTFLQGFSFDYLFSIINPTKIPQNVLSLARRQAINFHDAPLPRYAGLHVTSWALQRGEKSYGVTWHDMGAEFDTGDILVQETFGIDADETAFSLGLKCHQKGFQSFELLLKQLASGIIEPTKQDLDKRSVFLSHKRPEFLGLIDWNLSTHDLIKQARSIDFQTDDNPLCLSKIYVNGEFLLIDGGIEAVAQTGQPSGYIYSNDGSGLVIASSDSAIRIKGLKNLDGDKVSLASISEIQAGQVLSQLELSELSSLHEQVETFSRSEKYWIKELQGCEPYALAGHGVSLVSDPIINDGQCSDFVLADDLKSLLNTKFGDEPYQACAALFASFLARLADLESIQIGLRHGVTSPGVASSYFVSRVPLGVSCKSDDSLTQVIHKLKAQISALEAKGTFVRELSDRYAGIDAVHFPVALELVENFDAQGQCYRDALVLQIRQSDCALQWSFNQKSVDENQVAHFSDKFSQFVRIALTEPDTSFSSVSMLTQAERRQVLVDWNNTEKVLSETQCIHELIQEQVEATPDTIALAFRDQEITYKALNEQANALALKLQTLGASPDGLVGVFVERSIEMVVSMVAIHKSGAAYVPLDPAYPRDRVAMMIEDSGAKIVLTQSKFVHELSANIDTEVVCVDQLLSSLSGHSENVSSNVQAENLAYVIYTSGSTGRPKGVMVEHRNVANFFAGMDDTLDYQGKPGVWLAVTSISFDISVLEIFWSLARGFKVVIQEEDSRTINLSEQKVSQIDRKMDVGLFYFSSDAGPKEGGDRYRQLLEGAKYADENGFSTVWTPERHFHLFGGLYPNPSVTSAAIAAVTKNVAIRAGSIVLPIHNPIRIAEEWSVVDNLSNGRVGFSFASGWHANDFSLMPDNYENRKQIMFDGIETVQKLWRGESVTVKNGEGNPFEAKIYPAPVQKKPPVWITTAGNIDTFRQAGEGGHNILTNLLGQSIEDIKSKIDAYREGRKSNGFEGDGNVSVMVHTFVGADVDEVKEVVREPFSNYLKTSFDLVKIAPWAFPAFSQPSKAASQDKSFDPASFTTEDMDALIDHAFERYFEAAGIFGTPTSCLKLIDQLKQAGVDEVACLVDFGADDELVLGSLPYLKKLHELANPKSSEASGENFSTAQQLLKQEVTHFQCTPSMARILTSDPDTLKAMQRLDKLLLGGEALPDDLAELLVSNTQGDLINVYGPTETTIWSTSTRVLNNRNEVTIGRPIANTQIYVLDSALQPLPVGVPGEMYIGGLGVVRGYLDRPELSDERFINNPCAEELGNNSKIYRTGDLVRYLDNGDIEFLGRIDHQVKIRGYRIELGEIESLITSHSKVKESVITAPVSEQGTQSLVAYVVSNQSGSSDETGHWQTLWDQAYQGNINQVDGAKQDLTFDTSGWLNSFTGQAHDAAHMREWLDATVDRILALKPLRVLEIGCGTGMILYRVAAECEHYTGVDFSESALEQISRQLFSQGLADKVTLLQGEAATLDLHEQFDLIVINSVAQYFPSAEYLDVVLGKCLSWLNDDGQVFVGDVRHRALKGVFHSAIQTYKAAAQLSVGEIVERVEEHMSDDGELLIDPDFFGMLAKTKPSIAHVNAQLKRGHFVNEMSAYRYDVVLSKSMPSELCNESDFSEVAYPGSLQALEKYVRENKASQYVVRDIPNARLTKDVLVKDEMVNKVLSTAADVLAKVEYGEDSIGIDPERVYQMTSCGDVELLWASSGALDKFDAYFYSEHTDSTMALPVRNGNKVLAEYCDQPVSQGVQHEIVEELKDLLRANLPEFMLPDDFLFLPSMPLTPNGKINRNALPKPVKKQRESQENYVAPSNDIEQIIASVFQEMLNLERIGVKDNFFNIGVNSLLIAQANNHLNQRLDTHVSLVSMYRFPTVASLAEHLGSNQKNSEGVTKGTARAEKRKAAQANKKVAKRVVRRRS